LEGFVSEVKDAKVEPGVALWCPNAAASWSLLFTPVFGAYLHALNWRALGEHERARASMSWFYVGLGLLAFLAFLAFLGIVGFYIGPLAGLVYLLAWYFSSARVQVKRVKQRYGDSFPRKPWRKSLLIATGAGVGYLAIVKLVVPVLILLLVMA